MLHDEDYDSDTSDEDFVPQGVESDDDVISDAPEDSDVENADATTKKKKSKGKNSKSKKRKTNPLLSDVPDLDKDNTAETEPVEDVHDEKKADDLWADFLADTEEKPAPKPKSKSWATLLGGKKSTDSSVKNDEKKTNDATKINNSINKEKDKKVPEKVKITKVFEFAGEEVRVEEEVASNSEEAKLAQLQQTKETGNKNTSDSSSPSVSSKRPAGLSSILGILDNKKQKLSTLEKTKLDWNKYKTSEGIVEELEMHKKSKDGYLEKKEFLERADLRQFEIERTLRMGGKRSSR